MKKLPGITLSNGYHINSVVLDCCLGIDGFGPPGLFKTKVNNKIDRKNSTTILKSVTRFPKIGNYGSPWYLPNGWAMTDYFFPLPKKFCYTKLDDGSTVNSFGLSNDGIDDLNQNIKFHPSLLKDGIIISIFIEFGKGTKEDIENAKAKAIYIANLLKKELTASGYKIKAVIVNISCPNDGDGVCIFEDEIVETIKILKNNISPVPVGIKYSYMQNISLAVRLDKEAGIDFHQAINTIPFKEVYGDNKFSPLSHIGHGGVSGTAITEMALDYGKRLREALPKAKLILGGGITNLEEAKERAKYADAIAIATLVEDDTKEANKIISYFAQGGQENG